MTDTETNGTENEAGARPVFQTRLTAYKSARASVRALYQTAPDTPHDHPETLAYESEVDRFADVQCEAAKAVVTTPVTDPMQLELKMEVFAFICDPNEGDYRFFHEATKAIRADIAALAGNADKVAA